MLTQCRLCGKFFKNVHKLFEVNESPSLISKINSFLPIVVSIILINNDTSDELKLYYLGKLIEFGCFRSRKSMDCRVTFAPNA